jgi:hypothetical protein
LPTLKRAILEVYNEGIQYCNVSGWSLHYADSQLLLAQRKVDKKLAAGIL